MLTLNIGSQAKATPSLEVVCAKPHKVTGQRMRIASDNPNAIAGYFDRNGTNTTKRAKPFPSFEG